MAKYLISENQYRTLLENLASERNLNGITLYHGTNEPHEFTLNGFHAKGSFFSKEISTAEGFGKIIYVGELKPNLKICDFTNEVFCQEILDSFGPLYDHYYDEDEEGYEVTSGEFLSNSADSWGAVESSDNLLSYLMRSYDVVMVTEGGEFNYLISSPVAEKFTSLKLLSETSMNEGIGHARYPTTVSALDLAKKMANSKSGKTEDESFSNLIEYGDDYELVSVPLNSVSFDYQGLAFERPDKSREVIGRNIKSLQNKEPLQPLILNNKGAVIDGNHRALSHHLSGNQEVMAYVPKGTDVSKFDNLNTRFQRTGTSYEKYFGKDFYTKSLNEGVMKGTKVADKEGNPIVVYHGTKGEFSDFEKSTIGKNYGQRFGNGFYFTEQKSSADYYAKESKGTGGERIVSAYLDIKNPLVINSVPEYRAAVEAEIKKRSINKVEIDKLLSKDNNDILKEAGYDGVIFLFNGEMAEIVAFDESQIKQITHPSQSLSEQGGRAGGDEFAAKGGNRVVDDKGDPLVLYHGTPESFGGFDIKYAGKSTDSGMFGKGFYFTDNKKEANTYTKRGDKAGGVIEVYISMKNPYIINSKLDIPKINTRQETIEDLLNAADNYSAAFTKHLQDKGYDGVIDNLHSTKQYVVFDASQIKIKGQGPQPSVSAITESKALESVKKGVNEVFAEHKMISAIGTQEEYSQYLSTIFPDSKVKDIVYHGAMEQLLPKDEFKGFVTYFTNSKKYAETFGVVVNRKVLSAIINIKNAYNSPSELADVPQEIHNSRRYTNPRIIKSESGWYDSVIGVDAGQKEGDTFVVFNPEQIHILGSKKDIEGFKKWKRLTNPNKLFSLFQKLNNSF